IFQQSPEVLDAEGKTVRYRAYYYNRLPEAKVGRRGGDPATPFQGGNGGNGAHGGHGGGGGGGQGGYSWGIMYFGTPVLNSNNSLSGGAAGAAGLGGVSSPSWADGNNGTAGAAGTLGAVLTCSSATGC
ncbi:MAG: hypothetical protein ABMA64_24605, partial [Myxococcota bacterium]